jgi:hypothetical protein
MAENDGSTTVDLRQKDLAVLVGYRWLACLRWISCELEMNFYASAA